MSARCDHLIMLLGDAEVGHVLAVAGLDLEDLGHGRYLDLAKLRSHGEVEARRDARSRLDIK